MILTLFLQTAAPILPAGLNEQFVGISYAIEQKLALSDFAAATTLAQRLPKSSFVIAWDASNVPANRRNDFRVQRDKAIKEWSYVQGANITARDGKSGGNILIDFTESLPRSAEGIPAGAVFEFSDSGNPRLHCTIALKRSTPLVPVLGVNIHNEV